MNIDNFFHSLAGLMSQLYVLDVNGDPTTRHMNARAQAPMSLAETDLPTWIFLPLKGRYPDPPDQSEERFVKETRAFDIRLYVTITQTGIDGEAQRRVQPYLDIGRDHIQSHVQLWDSDPDFKPFGIQRAWLTEDSGVATLRYGIRDNPLYLGVSFITKVECYNEVHYGSQ